VRGRAGRSVRGQGEAECRPMGEGVSRHGRRWEGEGVWSETGEQMEGRLLVCGRTDLSAEQVQVAWDQLRIWIEDEGTDRTRGGLGLEQTNRSEAERARRRGLAMWWVVVVGGEEEANEQAGRPRATRRKVGRPPKALQRSGKREQRGFVRGHQAISAAALRGDAWPSMGDARPPVG
jgi:hypothetical protein